MDYKEIMDMIIDELIERSYQQQRDEDFSLDSLITKHLALHGQLEQLLSPLENHARQVFEEYHKIGIDIDGLQERYRYIQGAKDCVILLKALGVL